MKQTALLLIDVQRAFFDGEALEPVHDGATVLLRIAETVERARARDVPVFHVQHAGKPGHPLEPEGRGWQFRPETAPREGEAVVSKTTPDAFRETGLDALLKQHGISRLVVAGNQTEFCVDTTCRRACGIGYETILLKDAHSTWNSEVLPARQIIDHHNFVLGRQFVRLSDAAAFDFRED